MMISALKQIPRMNICMIQVCSPPDVCDISNDKYYLQSETILLHSYLTFHVLAVPSIRTLMVVEITMILFYKQVRDYENF